MKTIYRWLAAISFLALGSGSAHAMTILLQSTLSQLAPQVVTSIIAEGLGNHAPPSLGAFDLTLHFDTAALQFNQVVFPAALGVPENNLFKNVGGTVVPSPSGFDQALADASLGLDGSLRLTEVSLLEVSPGTCIFCTGPYLEDLQSSQFVIANVAFNALVELPNVNPGRLGYVLTVHGLSDAFGNSLAFEGVRFLPVSAPSTMLLFIAGLLSFVPLGVKQHRRMARPANTAT